MWPPAVVLERQSGVAMPPWSGCLAGFTCKTARCHLKADRSRRASDLNASRGFWAGAGSPLLACLASLPPVAQGSFQTAQRRVNQAVALGVGAACVHPAQAGIVEEAEVSPQGEVVVVAPAAALYRGPSSQETWRRGDDRWLVLGAGPEGRVKQEKEGDCWSLNEDKDLFPNRTHIRL